MIEEPMDRDKAMNRILSLTDKQIKDLYLNNPEIPVEWKEVIKNLKTR
jgi:hypothetical protein